MYVVLTWVALFAYTVYPER